ncbi:MAG: O-antigen ligase family protein [Rickettsiales bacterium]|nr:O-antigen ligase family protein [Rickettsiales bacterium]
MDIRLVPIGRVDNQIVAAYLYEIVGIISLYLYNIESSWQKKVGFVFGMLVIGALILYTRSRMQIFTYFMCISIGTIWYSRSLFKTFVSYALVAAFVVLICLHPTLNLMLSDYFSSLLSRGSSFRYEIWSNTLISIFESPFFGSGVKAKTYYGVGDYIVKSHPHNIILGTIFYFGIFVGMFFCFILYRILLCALRESNRHKPLNVLAMLLFFNGIVSSMTDNPRIVTTPPFWLMFWFPIAFVVANEIKHKVTVTKVD